MARTGSITSQDQDFVETWENIATRQNAIIRLDTRGDEKQEVIVGRRKFMLTSEERLITQNKVLQAKDDPFKNGDFRPIVVPDSVTAETNPNALSDDEILQMFNVSDAAWLPVLETIDSVATLRRMLDLAEQHDSLTVRRLKDMEQRLVLVRGTDRPRLTSKDDQLNRFLSDKPGGQSGAGGKIANDGGGNPRRGMGGRSSDYR